MSFRNVVAFISVILCTACAPKSELDAAKAEIAALRAQIEELQAHKPQDDEIRVLTMNKLLSDGGSEYFDVENFQKTDGFERNDKTYVANIKYELVFKKGLKEMAKDAKSVQGMGALVSEVGIFMLQAQYGDFQAGFKAEKEEKIILMKTETGWHIIEEGQREPF